MRARMVGPAGGSRVEARSAVDDTAACGPANGPVYFP